MINYVVIKRKNPANRTAPEKYYLAVKSLGAVNRDNFVQMMVNNTSLTAAEAGTALDYLVQAMIHYLQLGFTVKMGELGYFHPTIKSEGVENEKDAGADKIKALKVRFVPGLGFNDFLTKAKVENFSAKLSSASSGGSAQGNTPAGA